MKKILLLMVAMLLIASGPAFAVIAGSAHDLSDSGPVPSDAGGALSACQFCHTPHHADTSEAGMPLWNRFSPDMTAYTLYDSGEGGTGSEATLSGTTVGTPGVHSATCMSCHDGSIAYGDVILGGSDPADGVPATAAGLSAYTDMMTDLGNPNVFLGTDLSDTHPVGIVYDTDASLAGLSATSAQLGSSTVYTVGVGATYKIYGGDIMTGTVECASCHNPHGDDYDNPTGSATEGEPFLRGLKNEMCVDCHDSK